MWSFKMLQDNDMLSWLWELIYTKNMKHGIVRGERCLVEEPETHGWTLETKKQALPWAERLWHGHGWQDPRETTLTDSEDEHVIEVEHMARAWERGLAM